MGRQVLSSQSPPSFRSTALAFPLFPGSCMRKPFTHDKPETPMPLVTASLHPPQPFHFVPAIHPAQHPVTLLPNDQHPAPFRISNPVSPHTSAPLSPPVSADRFLGFWMPCAGARTRCSGVRRALTPSVLVNSAWGFWRSCAAVLAFGSGAWKAVSHSVSVKRVAQALVHFAPAIDQRLGVQRWPWNGSAKRVLGLGSAVARYIRQARKIVLVKCFSGFCNAPLPPLCDPGARSALNGSGVRRA